MNKRSASNHLANGSLTKHKRLEVATENEGKQAKWKFYFEDGRQAFLAKQYKEAIDYFTYAIEQQPTNITLLDSRSATWEKLHDWETATKDAMSILRLSPTSSKGYLRLGKLLSLQERYSSALKVYRRGHKLVDPKDSRYSLLLSLETETEAKVTARLQRIQGQRDPLKMLPYDVLDQIFSYLPFQHRVISTQVCQDWRRFLLAWSGMWRDLDFMTGQYKRKPVSRHTLSKYFSHAKGRHIRRFALSRGELTANYALDLIRDNGCQYLEYLALADVRLAMKPQSLYNTVRLMGKHLTHFYLDNCDVSFDTTFQMVTPLCPFLTCIYFRSQHRIAFSDSTSNVRPQIHPKVKQIYLSAPITIKDLSTVLHFLPNLTHFFLQHSTLSADDVIRLLPPTLRVYHHDKEHSLDLSLLWKRHAMNALSPTSSSSPSSTKMTNANALSEFSVTGHVLSDATMTSMIEKHRTTLETINLSHSHGFSDAWCSLLNVNPGCFVSPLRELHLAMWNDIQTLQICQLVSNCPQLEVVNFSFMHVTNEVLQHLSQLAHLQQLDISGCPSVTGSGLRHLVDQRKYTLKQLKLNDCTSIQPDAIQYARSNLGNKVVECRFA